MRVNFGSPRTRALIVHCPRDWGRRVACLIRPVWSGGHAGSYNQATGPPMPACLHTGAFNGRPSGARHGAGGTDVTPRTDMNRGYSGSSQGTPAYRTIKLASRGGECKSLVCCHNTQHRRRPFAFNRRQLLVSSSHRAERVSCAGSCWSSQEGWSAAAMSIDGYELPNGTAGSLAHSGPRESDPDRRARAAELLPAPAVLIT